MLPGKPQSHKKNAIKGELEKVEADRIIRRVTEPTDWVSSLAYSHKKGGDLRICLDPRHLNKALKRPHYKIPTVEVITHMFRGARVFSKLDSKARYRSVQLDTSANSLLCSNLHSDDTTFSAFHSDSTYPKTCSK